mgnify:CR=1 FL=1
MAEDFEVKCGEMADTAYKIPKRREDGSTILDMAQNALDLTMIHTKKMFVLYDDCGELKLTDVEALQTDLYIDAETAQNLEYTSTVDKDVYNLIKLSVDDGSGGHRLVYAPAKNQDYEKSETRKHGAFYSILKASTRRTGRTRNKWRKAVGALQSHSPNAESEKAGG